MNNEPTDEVIELAEKLYAQGTLDANENARLNELLKDAGNRNSYLKYLEMCQNLDERVTTKEPSNSEVFSNSANPTSLGEADSYSSAWTNRIGFVVKLAACAMIAILISSSAIAAYNGHKRRAISKQFLEIAAKVYEEDMESTIELQNSLKAAANSISLMDFSGQHQLDCCDKAVQAIKAARDGFPDSALQDLVDATQLLREGDMSPELEVPVSLVISKAAFELAEIMSNRTIFSDSKIDRKEMSQIQEVAYRRLLMTVKEIRESEKDGEVSAHSAILLSAIETDLGRMMMKNAPPSHATDDVLEERYPSSKRRFAEAARLLKLVPMTEQGERYWRQRIRLQANKIFLNEKWSAVDKTYIPTTETLESTRKLNAEVQIWLKEQPKSSTFYPLKMELGICFLNHADMIDRLKVNDRLEQTDYEQYCYDALEQLKSIPVKHRTDRCRENIGHAYSGLIVSLFNKTRDDNPVAPNDIQRLKAYAFGLNAVHGNVLSFELGQILPQAKVLTALTLANQYTQKDIDDFIEKYPDYFAMIGEDTLQQILEYSKKINPPKKND